MSLPLALLRPRIVELLNIAQYTHQTQSIVPLDEPLFQPSPPAVVFDAFEPLRVYTVELRLRNNDAFARRIKLLPPQSAVFAVERQQAKAGGGTKVAPGMDAVYRVTFAPRDPVDYSCDLLCVSEREKFVVPMRARGPRAQLDFPDLIAFGTHPVRSLSSEAVLVRNTGGRASRVSVSVPPPFSVTPAHALLAVDEAVQFEFAFLPDACGEVRREFRVEYETGEACYGALSGAGADVDVRLETTAVQCAHTYISLQSQKTMRVLNRSAAPLAFRWKLYADETDERDDKLERLLQLGALEAAADADARADAANGDVDENAAAGLFGSASCAASAASVLGEASAARLATSVLSGGGARAGAAGRSSLASMRQAVEEDELLYADPVFALEPASGVIYPGCHVEVTVTFAPTRAGVWRSIAYLDVTGREARAPLELSGTGLGPHAEFLFDSLDVGDVFINSIHQYALELENVGGIDLSYSLEHNDSFLAAQFEFAPAVARVPVGGTQLIGVRFTSDALGDFAERFNFVLDGQPEPLPVTIKGRVIGPTFSLEPADALAFGDVPFGMKTSRELEMHNSSEIPIRYSMRIGLDIGHDASGPPKSGGSREFEIAPSTGVLLPHGTQHIRVAFTPLDARAYSTSLVVDVDSVGEGLLALPLTARCVVPPLLPSVKAIDFARAFIRHPYSRTFTLSNGAPLAASFELVAYAPSAAAVATLIVEPASGVIEPSGSVEVSVTFAAQRLGRIEMPLHLRITGTTGHAGGAHVLLSAHAVGPTLELSSAAIDFGRIPVLQDRSVPLLVTNTSLIDAHISTAVRRPNSTFACAPRAASLAPGASATFTVTAHLDDAIKFVDELYLAIADSDELMVPLAASGSGTTVWCAHSLERVDFGEALTASVLSTELVLENRGRKPLALSFASMAAEDARRAAPRGAAGRTKGVEPPPACFRVVPAQLTIDAKSDAVISVRALSASRVGLIEERIAVTAKAVTGKEKPLVDMIVSATFSTPLVRAEPPELHFEYLHDAKAQTTSVHSKPLALHNLTALPLTLMLRAKPPFAVDRSELHIAPRDSAPIAVSWDPAFRNDRQSDLTDAKLTITYREHPQRNSVRLVGDAQFPNVAFDLRDNRVDFGAVLNDSGKKVVATMTNTSRVDVVYAWYHDESADSVGPAGSVAGDLTARSVASRAPAASQRSVSRAPSERSYSSKRLAAQPIVRSAELFDVLPLRGVLRPGESQAVQFTYAGQLNRRARCGVVCVIDGGPEYPLVLAAESSVVTFHIERTDLECGIVPMERVIETEVVLTNPGRVGRALAPSAPPPPPPPPTRAHLALSLIHI